MPHFFTCPLGGEPPLDAGASGIPLIVPSGDLRFETFTLGNAAVQALRTQHADFNAAKSWAVRRSVTLAVRQGLCASRKMNKLAVPFCFYS
jgi:hypothetical protein